MDEIRERNTVRICVSVGAASIRKLKAEVSKASRFADFVELRLDYLLEAELADGKCSWDATKRLEYWLNYLAPTVGNTHFADIELDLALLLLRRNQQDASDLDWNRIICSYHSFVPISPDGIYAQMAKLPSHILKIAFEAREITDALPVFRLLERA